jgi:hypothetical protein
LLLGSNQIATRALLLNDKHALPKQIDEAPLVAELLYRLLVTRDAATGNAEDFKEFVIEGLRLAAFITGVLPLFGEVRRADTNFLPLSCIRPRYNPGSGFADLARRVKPCLFASR